MLGIPDTPEVRAWVGALPAAVTDADLEDIIDAELDLQAAVLRIPEDPDPYGEEATYPPALARALLRRVQRQVAARQLPLGMVGDTAGEYGMAYLRTWDPEIRRLEDPYRIPVIA